MVNTQKVLEYIASFNALAVKTTFRDNTLLYCFYKGLAPHIKNAITHNDWYSTLWELKAIVHSIDLCYWENKEECEEEHQQTSAKQSSSSGSGSGSKKNKGQSSSSSQSNKQNQSSDKCSDQNCNNPCLKKSNQNCSNQNWSSNKSASSSSNTQTMPKPYAKFLGPDGKLKPEEKER